jgi:hypothetical protein
MSDERRRRLARKMLHRMGETGQPPERGTLDVNVGTEDLLEILREEYLTPIREAGRNSAFKLVQAPFGGGKTHFLHCLREVAWQEGFVTALVGVSPNECPFDDTEKIYAAVARSLEMPPADADEEAPLGIDAVLRAEIERRQKEHDPDAIRGWLHEECATARVDSHSVRRAGVLFLEAVLDGESSASEILGAYLRGESVTSAEMERFGLREAMDSATAFRFLRSLIQILRALDVPGLVLLFDELDRVMSLTVRRRRAIGDNLRQMIDHCGQATLPALLWVYAVPPEFLTTVVPEYAALEQRLRGATRFSAESPLSPIIDLDHLPLGPTQMLQRIGQKLLSLNEEAYGPLDPKLQNENLFRLAEELGESQLESGTRRTFVKAAIQLLVQQKRGKERRLTDSEIRTLGQRGAVPAATPLEDEETFE